MTEIYLKSNNHEKTHSNIYMDGVQNIIVFVKAHKFIRHKFGNLNFGSNLKKTGNVGAILEFLKILGPKYKF